MIITSVLDYWVDIFTVALRDDTTDELKMNLIKKAPFQDDPVRQAPYLLIGENDYKGVVPHAVVEIGGPMNWDVYLSIKASPKVQKTTQRAYYLVDLLAQRIVYLIRQHSMTQAQYGNVQLQNRDWMLIEKVHHKVYGGEGEWLSYARVDFFQRVSEVGPYPYGAYPGTIL